MIAAGTLGWSIPAAAATITFQNVSIEGGFLDKKNVRIPYSNSGDPIDVDVLVKPCALPGAPPGSCDPLADLEEVGRPEDLALNQTFTLQHGAGDIDLGVFTFDEFEFISKSGSVKLDIFDQTPTVLGTVSFDAKVLPVLKVKGSLEPRASIGGRISTKQPFLETRSSDVGIDFLVHLLAGKDPTADVFITAGALEGDLDVGTFTATAAKQTRMVDVGDFIFDAGRFVVPASAIPHHTATQHFTATFANPDNPEDAIDVPGQFTITVVPEPGLALLVAAAVVVGTRCRRRFGMPAPGGARDPNIY